MAKKSAKSAKGRKRRSKKTDDSVDALGYRRLAENPRKHHVVTFGDVLPDLIAKYGLARKLSIARFEETFRAILNDLFPHSPMSEEREERDEGDKGGERGKSGDHKTDPGLNPAEETGESFGFFDAKSFRLIGFRAGTLQIEVSDAPLLSESTFYEGEILRRFQEALPNEKIRRIRFILR